jgi:malonyl-CoA/methylmalonyl-CoA synthetase
VNLAHIILEVAAAAPSTLALVVLDQAGGVTDTVTYGELLADAARWQVYLADNGARADSLVALALPRSRDLAAVHIAALASGATIVPLNTALSERERQAVLAAAGASVFVVDETVVATVRKRWAGEDDSANPVSPVAASPRRKSAEPLKVAPRNTRDAALLIFTSGTTGKPKSVPLTHGNLAADLGALNSMWRRTASDRLLHMLPAHHLHGLGLALYGSLLVGGTIVLMPDFDARRALDAIRDHAINVVMGVPTMYARMIGAASAGDDLSVLRLALCGSAPLGLRAWGAFRERFGVPLIERYGLTETGIITSNPLDAPVGGSVGVAIPGTSVVLLTDKGYVGPSPGSRSARGEVCIAGPTVMPGYGNDPEANAAAFVDGYFRSGDLGYFDEHGYLWIDGRLKDLIIVGGSNVVPAEVERALEGVSEIGECAAVGLPDPDLGEIVAVFVVAADPTMPTARIEAAVNAAADAALARYKRPRLVIVVPELPRNAMGKIDRARLRTATSATGSR